MEVACCKALHAGSHWNTLKGIYLDLRNGIKNSFEVKWTTIEEGNFPSLKWIEITILWFT